MKKTISVILTFALLSMLCIPMHAAQVQPASVQWDCIDTITGQFVFASADSAAAYEIACDPTVEEIYATLIVYRYLNDRWIYIADTSKTVEDCYMTIAVPFTALRGGEYKCVFEAECTNSVGAVEEVSHVHYGTYD